MTDEKRQKTNIGLTTLSILCMAFSIVLGGMTIYNSSASSNQKKGVDQQRLLELEKGREENKANIACIKDDVTKKQEAVITAIEGLKGEVKNSNTKIDLMTKQIEKLDSKIESHIDASITARYKPTG